MLKIQEQRNKDHWNTMDIFIEKPGQKLMIILLKIIEKLLIYTDDEDKKENWLIWKKEHNFMTIYDFAKQENIRRNNNYSHQNAQ